MLDKKDLISLQKILIFILGKCEYDLGYLDESCEDKQQIICNIEDEAVVILEIKYFHEIYNEIASLKSKLLPTSVRLKAEQIQLVAIGILIGSVVGLEKCPV